MQSGRGVGRASALLAIAIGGFERRTPPNQRKTTNSGEEIELRTRLVALDPLDQVATRESRLILWRDGQAVQQEERTLLERLYFRNELLAMLAAAGFRDVEVCEGYTGNRASPRSEILVYIARKE
jgi:hypothetical protein